MLPPCCEGMEVYVSVELVPGKVELEGGEMHFSRLFTTVM